MKFIVTDRAEQWTRVSFRKELKVERPCLRNKRPNLRAQSITKKRFKGFWHHRSFNRIRKGRKIFYKYDYTPCAYHIAESNTMVVHPSIYEQLKRSDKHLQLEAIANKQELQK